MPSTTWMYSLVEGKEFACFNDSSAPMAGRDNALTEHAYIPSNTLRHHTKRCLVGCVWVRVYT